MRFEWASGREIRCALNLDCLEDSQHCDCVLINGGNFRGERDYKGIQYLSLEEQC